MSGEKFFASSRDVFQKKLPLARRMRADGTRRFLKGPFLLLLCNMPSACWTAYISKV